MLPEFHDIDGLSSHRMEWSKGYGVHCCKIVNKWMFIEWMVSYVVKVSKMPGNTHQIRRQEDKPKVMHPLIVRYSI